MSHGCARTKGTVACWGNSIRGLLGDGNLREPSRGGGGGRVFCGGEYERCVPTPIASLHDVAQIAGGPSHTCARLAGGTVLCWGQNDQGQVGDDTTTPRPRPTPVRGLTDAVEIAAGQSHTCARRKDSSVSCWGGNGFGQLGDGATKDRGAPAAVTGLRDVAQIACGGMRSCARLVDGTVSCWGIGQSPRGPVPGLVAIADIAVGGAHACARAKDGALSCWGDNSAGQLGDGTNERRTAPVRVAALTGTTLVALGARHTCVAAGTGGETWCWGANANHELGDGTTDERHAPTRIVYR